VEQSLLAVSQACLPARQAFKALNLPSADRFFVTFCFKTKSNANTLLSQLSKENEGLRTNEKKRTLVLSNNGKRTT
jgi:hypothetical protein